ncbi:MAG TPA: TraB/GumN family protein [Puia sp.]|nr:TraB/GumN family protein [Puia sp.]
MRSIPFRLCALGAIFCLFFLSSSIAQEKPEKKYPSLLWEITGNGLTRPSYLFGTMHVSSKLVFHLSDSFYLDIKSCDIVALELDPQLWQDQLFRFENMESNLRFYTQGSPNDYLNEKSFQLERYDDRLKSALSDEPTIINGLLYRTYRTRADFEEDTYLDLYIYQTGRKLGKQATGVENYFQTERLVMEAAQDMMKDRKKKVPDMDGESAYDLERKTQEAYRQGDLDLLDSLEKLMEPSEAYMEKFLYRRNEIQAASIDSIVKRHSLFVGVGAAHLPGRRGVIELLRKKGYILRPVIMPDRDAPRRDDIDKIKVPVTFSKFTADDGAFSVSVPGILHRRPESHGIDDSWQYADMSNGAYYMIGRVNTHSSFLGEKNDAILRKIDSLLYENIPGKILKKSGIVRSGYRGFDISSRTRRGDLQRYNILVTPYEIWVFKMSGNNNYVDGAEADQFFNSIHIQSNTPAGWTDFSPVRGGFSVRLPRVPRQDQDLSGIDGITRWEYEATDSATGDAFLIWKKTVQNYRFLEEDTADLALMEESFRLSDWIGKPLSRKTGSYKGHACLDAAYQAKDGSWIKARFLVYGPDYYVLAARSRTRNQSSDRFFSSFSFIPYRYPTFRDYADTFIHIAVTTPMVPDVDAGMRRIVERAASEEFLNSLPDYNNYWPHPRTALFQDDSTGEAVFVSVESFPKYYYPKDTATFWSDEMNEKRLDQDMIAGARQPFSLPDSTFGYRYTLTDTNSTRHIRTWIFLNGNRLFRILSLSDSADTTSEFIRRFYATLKPLGPRTGPSVFDSKLAAFFDDFYSTDSLTAQRARDAIPNVYFGPAGVPALLQAINTLPYNGKDYFETKTRLINELGYINDPIATGPVVEGLRRIYERAGDTSTIQNAVFKALAHHKTRAAYDLLRRLMIQDPPIFENNTDYTYLFQDLGDSLALARTLFPDLLQLASVDDYKGNIQTLLASLVDSGYIQGPDYESYFSQIWFDARIQWKKQEGKDEKKLQKKEDDNDDNSSDNDADDNNGNDLDAYGILLAPFYDKNPNIPRFFDKMLASKDASLRLSTAILLLRHDRPVADSILRNLAASDTYRSDLYQQLTAIGKADRFPRQYRNQLDMARSLLASGRGNAGLADIQLITQRKIRFKELKGYVYFFKYKPAHDDDWQIGISGIQPSDLAAVNTAGDFVLLTGKKLKPGIPVNTQIDDQLRKLMFSKRKSALNFYLDHNYLDRTGDDE